MRRVLVWMALGLLLLVPAAAAGPTAAPARVAEGEGAAGSLHRTVALAVNFTDARQTPFTVDALRERYFTGPASVAAFFREGSDGAVRLAGRDRLDGDVHGWLTLPIAATCDQSLIAGSADARIATVAGIDVNQDYEHVSYVFPYNAACPWNGIADVGGRRTWINGLGSTGVIAHEIGHNMGADHASSYVCTDGGTPVSISATCTYRDYGDPFDAMGSGSRLFSAWYRFRVGHLDGSSVRIAEASGRYAFASPNDAAAPEPNLVLVPRTSGRQLYALEIRSDHGTFDRFPGSFATATTGVTIRLVSWDPNSYRSLLIDTNPATPAPDDAPLQPGRTFVDEQAGITITNAGSGDGLATVDVTRPTTPVADAGDPFAASEAPAPEPSPEAARPTVRLMATLSRRGTARIPASGRVRFAAAGARTITVRMRGRTTTRRGGSVAYVVPARLRRRGTATLRVTAKIGEGSVRRTFRIARGRIG